MKIDKSYEEFILSIKQQIVQSRYVAAKLPTLGVLTFKRPKVSSILNDGFSDNPGTF